MLLTLNEVLESKIYVSTTSRIQFSSPKIYIDPFLNAVKSDDITVKVQDPVINKNEDGTENISYPRVGIECKVGNEIVGYDSVIGLIFALNIQNPVIKIYTGQNAHACTNLTIFNASAVAQRSLMNDFMDIYSVAQKYFTEKQREIEQFTETRERLLNQFYNEEELKNELGRLLLLTTRKNSKLSYGIIAGASKLIQDQNSQYYVQPGTNISKMKLYDAITQNITNSPDILHKPNKTLAVSHLLGVN